jgi:hypothetical protein
MQDRAPAPARRLRPRDLFQKSGAGACTLLPTRSFSYDFKGSCRRQHHADDLNGDLNAELARVNVQNADLVSALPGAAKAKR